MSEKKFEELLRQIDETEKKREKIYAHFKGYITGIRTSKLSPLDTSFLQVMELMGDGFNSFREELDLIAKVEVTFFRRAQRLETKIEELETNILQLRETLDRMVQDR